MSRFRAAFRSVIRSQLRIYAGSPSSFGGPEPSAYRAFILKTFFRHCDAVEVTAVNRLLNGNWEVSGEIQHFCSGPGCCSSPIETENNVVKWLLKTCVGKGPRIFPRHKWLGADEAVDWFGRLMGIHSVLRSVISVLWGNEFRPGPGPRPGITHDDDGGDHHDGHDGNLEDDSILTMLEQIGKERNAPQGQGSEQEHLGCLLS